MRNENQEIECKTNGELRLSFCHGRVILIFGKGGKVVIQRLYEELHLVVTEREGVRKEV